MSKPTTYGWRCTWDNGGSIKEGFERCPKDVKGYSSIESAAKAAVKHVNQHGWGDRWGYPPSGNYRHSWVTVYKFTQDKRKKEGGTYVEIGYAYDLLPEKIDKKCHKRNPRFSITLTCLDTVEVFKEWEIAKDGYNVPELGEIIVAMNDYSKTIPCNCKKCK